MRACGAGNRGARGDRGERCERLRIGAEEVEQIGDVVGAHGLVERDSDAAGAELAQVDAAPRGVGEQAVGVAAGRGIQLHGEGVEERLLRQRVAGAPQAFGERHRHLVNAHRDRPQPLRAVVDGVHRSENRRQHLRGADVGGRLLAPDVLLAGLQRHADGGISGAVLRHADDPAGHLALELVAHRHEGGVRPAVTHRQPEALRRADGDVGAELARRPQEREREQIGRDDQEGVAGVGELRERRVVEDLALGGRVLHQHSEDPPAGEIALERVAGLDLDSHRPGARLDDGDRLRMAGAVDEEHRALDLLEVRMNRGAHVHRLGRRGGLVEQRGVRDRQRGQVGDQGLEVEQRFQTSLRDLGLVGRVLRVPARILEDVPLDDAGHARRVVPESEVGA